MSLPAIRSGALQSRFVMECSPGLPGQDRRVITADDVDTLLFDLLATWWTKPGSTSSVPAPHAADRPCARLLANATTTDSRQKRVVQLRRPLYIHVALSDASVVMLALVAA